MLSRKEFFKLILWLSFYILIAVFVTLYAIKTAIPEDVAASREIALNMGIFELCV